MSLGTSRRILYLPRILSNDALLGYTKNRPMGPNGLFVNGIYTHPKCVICVRLGLVTLHSQVERRSIRTVGDTVYGVRCPIKFRGHWTNFRGEYAMTKMVPGSKSLGKSLCQHACWRFPARLAPRHHSPMRSNWGMCHLNSSLPRSGF